MRLLALQTSITIPENGLLTAINDPFNAWNGVKNRSTLKQRLII